MRLLALRAVWDLAMFTHDRVIEREEARCTPILSSPDKYSWLGKSRAQLCRSLQRLWSDAANVMRAVPLAENCLRRFGPRVHRCPVCGRSTDLLEQIVRFKGPRFIKIGEPYPEIERLIACRPCGARWYQEWLHGPEYQAWLDQCHEEIT